MGTATWGTTDWDSHLSLPMAGDSHLMRTDWDTHFGSPAGSHENRLGHSLRFACRISGWGDTRRSFIRDTHLSPKDTHPDHVALWVSSFG
jgi:hypothetical protein